MRRYAALGTVAAMAGAMVTLALVHTVIGHTAILVFVPIWL